MKIYPPAIKHPIAMEKLRLLPTTTNQCDPDHEFVLNNCSINSNILVTFTISQKNINFYVYIYRYSTADG